MRKLTLALRRANAIKNRITQKHKLSRLATETRALAKQMKDVPRVVFSYAGSVTKEVTE